MPWTFTREGDVKVPTLPKGVTKEDFLSLPTGHPDISWFDGRVWWYRNGYASGMELIG